MRAVMVDEDPKHAIELGGRHVSALGDESPLDHAARTAADHSPRSIGANRRQAFCGEDELSVEIRSGAESTSVPSRSKTMVRMIPY